MKVLMWLGAVVVAIGVAGFACVWAAWVLDDRQDFDDE